MTVMQRERNWKIELLGNEHGIPHFHLRWPGGKASISIETLDVLAGKPPVDVLEAARAWTRQNQTKLLLEWKRLNPGR
ncbi:MAG: DUF4160 domain-containing protein [Deltaproteobacteria bacterium]|nr:DUF4160 domain-containing protein [Deltaproteobacteria bacterium]